MQSTSCETMGWKKHKLESRLPGTIFIPALQVDSLPAEPQGKYNNTGVDSLFPSPGDLPDPGIQPGSPALQADSLPTALYVIYILL